MNKSSVITADEMEEVLQTSLSPALRKECDGASLRYEEISDKERDDYIREVVDVLFKNILDKDTKPAGQHRLQEWEQGWNENLEALKKGKDVKDIVPRYHGKHKLVHWRQRMIRPITPDFDYKILCFIVDWSIETFLRDVDVLFEFGCGPAYHLLRARKYNPQAKMIGLDWTKTSQEIIKQISNLGIDKNIEGRNFNFFEPDYSIEVPPKSGFLTVAALEQVGDRFDQFLEFVMNKKPSICVHFEPIDELLDQTHLIDRLSTLYFRKRDYLSGFLPKLHRLQDEGKIKILREQRTYTGSFFIEGHSLVVWSPL
jgi:hypothetical protein